MKKKKGPVDSATTQHNQNVPHSTVLDCTQLYSTVCTYAHTPPEGTSGTHPAPLPSCADWMKNKQWRSACLRAYRDCGRWVSHCVGIRGCGMCEWRDIGVNSAAKKDYMNSGKGQQQGQGQGKGGGDARK